MARRRKIKRASPRRKKKQKPSVPRKKKSLRRRSKLAIRSLPKTPEPLLEALVGSPARARILRFLYRHPDSAFNAKTLAKALLLNALSVTCECDTLARIGIVKVRSGGARKRYQVSAAFPFSGELRAIALYSHTVTPAQIIAELSRNVQPRLVVISGAFLNVPGGPLDVFVVADRVSERALARSMRRLEAKLGTELRWSAFQTSEFTYRWKMFDRFLRSIFESAHEIILGKLPK